jgi:predicted AAA+ superfamily ATPase
MTSNSQEHIIGRQILPVIEQRLAEEAIILLQGPRSVGKSTVLRAVANKHKATIIDLDNPQTREAFNRDIESYLSMEGLILIDEYQKATELLSYIKAELNEGTALGRYLLTGSVRNESLAIGLETLTGRVHQMAIHPFTQREIETRTGNLLDLMFANPELLLSSSNSATLRKEYEQRVFKGGFPLAYNRATESLRNRWYADYIDRTLRQDVRKISRIRQVNMLPKLLSRLASQSAQILNIANAASALGLESRTAENYVNLLESVFLIQRLPAWGTTLGARISKSPKIHVVDSGLLVNLLKLSADKLQRRIPSAMSEFGHVLETFMVGEIGREASLSDQVHLVGHWRTRDDDEIDYIVENIEGGILAFEVKASTSVSGKDFDPMRKLRSTLGVNFLGGYVLYLGKRSFNYEDRLHAVTLDQLWSI